MSNILPFGRRPDDDRDDDLARAEADRDGGPAPAAGERSELAAVLDRLPDDVTVTAQALPPMEFTPAAASTPGELRPIVSPWMRSLAGWRAAARWRVGLEWYRLRFHLVRVPVYVARIAVRAPVGAVKAVWLVLRWALDVRADAMEQQLATGVKADSKEFRELREDRGRRIRARLSSLVVLGVVTVLALLLVLRSPWPAQVLAAVVVTAVFAMVGSPRGKPIAGPVMYVSAKWRELDDRILMRALRAAGLGGSAAKLDRDGRELEESTLSTLAQPIARSQNGGGYLCMVDLPYGKTAGDAAAAVDKLASGLDVDVTQVVVEPVAGRSRRVSLYVADEDPFSLPPTRSPLARLPRTSLWEPNPMASTPVGRVVEARLIFNSVLLGAVPRAGKSFSAKLIAAPGMLDPHTDVSVFDFGGGRDWLPARELAVDYLSGDEEDEIAAGVLALERIRGEVRERLATFRTLSGKELPEDKLTAELAAAGMAPKLVICDEVQNLLRSPHKELRKLGFEVLTWLVKTAPKAGVVTMLVTQRPAADVIPADLRDLITIRVALRTKSPQGSDAILGAYLSAQGWRTDRLLETHRGAAVIGGISNGQGGDLAYVRMHLLSPAEFEDVCRAGRLRRDEAGTLRGQAAGELDDVIVTVTVLDDVWNAWPGDQAKVQSRELLGRLRELYPRRYPAATTTTALTRELTKHGVPSVQVWSDGSNAQGYVRADVIKARTALTAAGELDQALRADS